jgi:hypothetical protein
MSQLAVESESEHGSALRMTLLTGADLAELDHARHVVRSAWLPMSSVRRDDFPLPRLGERLADLAVDLDRSDGISLLRGLRTSGYSEADLRLLYWGLARHLGVAVPQDVSGRLITYASGSDPAVRSGGSDVVSLLAVSGQHTVTWVSSRALYDEVVARRPELAERMFGTFAFDGYGEQGAASYRLLPLACWTDGRLSLRYDRRAIDQAQRGGAPTLTDADRELLDLMDELLPALRQEIRLEPGDILLIDNHEVLHQIDAAGGPAAHGRLLQLWLTLRNGRDLPDDYIWPTPTYGGEPGRGGITPLDVIETATAVVRPPRAQA